MSEEKFLNSKFKAYQEFDLVIPRTEKVIPCLLTGINYETRCIELEPIPNDYCESNKLWAHCNNVEFPKPRIKRA